MSTDPRHFLRATLYDLLLTNFPVEYDGVWDNDTQVQFENSKFNPPVESPFLAAYIIYSSGTRASIGTIKKFQRHEGFFCIECHVTEDTGMGTLWKISGAVERSLQEQQLALEDGSYVTLHVAKAVNNSAQDNRYFVTVMVPFCLDACMS